MYFFYKSIDAHIKTNIVMYVVFSFPPSTTTRGFQSYGGEAANKFFF